VVINQDQDTLAIMLGNGDGTFAAPVIHNLPPGVPMQVAVADFNNDGNADVAIITGSVNGFTSQVIVLLGNGNGNFASPISTFSGVNGLTIKAADVNGDGKQDVLIGGNGSAAVLYGKGDGTFQPPVLLTSGSYALVDVAAGDLNGDGRMDLVCAIFSPNAGIVVFLQNADGSFSAGQVLITQAATASAVATADFDGDGKLDIMLSASGAEILFLGNGDGTFQAPREILGGGYGSSIGRIAVADYNRDGLMDTAMNFYESTGWGLYVDASLFGYNFVLNNSSGGTTGVASGDFNGDGWPDLVTADSLGNRVTVFLNLVGVNLGPQQFVPMTPCRMFDSRPYGPMPSGEYGLEISPTGCGSDIPASASAYSFNVTVIPPGPLGFLTLYPLGGIETASNLNSLDGRTKAVAAIVPSGNMGWFGLYISDPTNLVIDVNGYFIPRTQSALAFYPVTPCRVFDTRNANGPLGGPYIRAEPSVIFPCSTATATYPATRKSTR
jgi:hypothetical protein